MTNGGTPAEDTSLAEHLIFLCGGFDSPSWGSVRRNYVPRALSLGKFHSESP